MKKSIQTILFLFTLSMTIHSLCAQKVYEIHNSYLKVSISEKGAELMSIKSAGKEYLWQGNAKYWDGRAPIMFPCNVRFKNDNFTYKGKQYTMPFMGIIRNSQMEAKMNKDSTTINLSYQTNDSILSHHYPFPCRLNVNYSLKGKHLTVTLTVRNTGKETLFYALGVHPGFMLESVDSILRKDYMITFANHPVSLIRTKVKSGVLLRETEQFIKNEKTIKLSDPRIATTGMYFGENGLKSFGIGKTNQPPFLYLETESFKNLNFWSPPGMPFVCLEPMISHHDFIDSPEDITKKDHLRQLAPQKTATYHFSIYIP